MTPDPAMPKAMQVEALKRIFKSLNPDIGIDMIDWEAHVDAALTLPENRIELSIIHPQYKWFTDELEMKDIKNEAKKEYKEYLDYLLDSAVLPEAREDMAKVFEASLSNYIYRTERNLERTTLIKTVKSLEKELTEAKRAGKPQTSIIKEEKRKIETPPGPRPPAFTSTLEKKLRDVFSASLTREGLSPTKFLSEYRVELENIRTLPTEEEMVAAVEALAAEIVRRELGRKIRPPRLREERPPPERIYRPRPEFREEEEEEEFITAPPAEFPVYPEKPFKTELYPSRRLTTEEREDIRDVFEEAVFMCGKKPERYNKEFNEWIETFLFDSWEQVKSNYANLIDVICREKKITLVPRALPAEVIDELIHWITSISSIEDVIDNEKILRKPETIEEVIDKLEQMGKPGVPPSDVIAAVKRGWKEKAPNYVIVEKTYLEKLIGEPLD